jgi:hypothetical protein
MDYRILSGLGIASNGLKIKFVTSEYWLLEPGELPGLLELMFTQLVAVNLINGY